MKLSLFGIRHHGPGSAKSLRAALKALQPDALLIESPADAEPLLAHVADPAMKPPVAMLLYDPQDFHRAAYYPFAEFSPEWQAIRYGIQKQIPIRFIDLPAANSLVFDRNAGPERQILRNDPLGEIARLAGYSDGERWWDAAFEQQQNELAIFEAVAELMEALRAEFPDDDPLTLAREAHMRERIRQAAKDGFQNAALVCGAWHVPALINWQTTPASRDKSALRGLAKTKIAAAWTPWTHERLSALTGYRAGVIAPAWYALLFQNRKYAVSRWMSRAARLLRGKGFDASSSSAIDAVVLAENLAALRGRVSPGLDELREAAESALCEGAPEKLELIEEKLIIGDASGRVPASIPRPPIQRDLEAAIKSARLSKEFKSIGSLPKDLDLRTPSNRLASQLLHRLNFLQIPWGKLKKGSRFKTGSFSENWRLKWLPDYSIRIIEASVWGATVREAAAARLVHEAAESDDLSELARWLDDSIKAGLGETHTVLLARIQEQAALTHDILRLIDALGPLAEILRYGDHRQTEGEQVAALIREFIPRICIGLLPVSMRIAEDLAHTVFDRLLELNRLIGLLDEPEYRERFSSALQGLAGQEQVNPLLQGAATRLLFDQGQTQAAHFIYYHLSPRQDPGHAAQWLEGFLHGSGLLLLYHPPLWQALDAWVASLSIERLNALLPVLRRTFSRFSAAERQKMLRLAAKAPVGEKAPQPWDEGLALGVERLVLAIVKG